jgi:large subunit ribosomal protein L5
MNPMKQIRIEKITLNIGTGKDQSKLDKARILLKNITGIEPVKTKTNKRIPTWGLRPGLPIGCKITLRKHQSKELLKRLLESKESILKDSQFDEKGNIAFGIHEYIDIPGVKYDPKVGIMGLQVCVTLERPGFRVKRRSLKRALVSKHHIISKSEAIEFMKKEFGIKIGE